MDPQLATSAYRDSARSIYDRMEDLLARMTIDEKIAPLGGIDPGEFLTDNRFDDVYFAWDPTGNRLVIQRAPIDSGDQQPEVWTYDTGTQAAQRLAINAFAPRWVR